MNAAEKIAGTYLRLNGFLLLPQFTIFDGGYHGHVDFVGLRAAGSKEAAGDVVFPLDETFFDVVGRNVCGAPVDRFLGLVAEVRTNNTVDRPRGAQIDYVRPFLGNVPVIPVFFLESTDGPTWMDDCVWVGNAYALKWISSRALDGSTRADHAPV